MKYKINILLFVFMLGPILLWGNHSSMLDCSSYFSWERISGSNTAVHFTNNSSGDITSWSWDFGDGATSGIYNPDHEYSSFGVYYVCLTVSDGLDCTDTYCDTIIVQPDCQADFNFTYVPTTPIYVQFTDLSTGYPDSWLWHFGDGTTSTDPNPVHPYSQAGSYDVCLIIEHNDSLYNCIDSICKTVIIPDSLNCQAEYTYEIDSDDPMKVHFFDLSSGNITDWEWNFGDGNISNERNPVHIFPGPAAYMVCLKVENSDTAEHCLHFICESITLSDSAFCTSDFVAVADSNSQVMYQYSFFDQSTGNPDLWMWTFGDGQISHDQDPVHAYENPGTYEVCLDTWNSNYPGCTDSYCILVKTAEYHQLGGLAFIGDNPINNPIATGDTGYAVLYREQADNSIIAIDTNSFHEFGYYWFSNMMEMGYRIKIGLTPGSVHYNEFIPSYYPSAVHWQDAEVFMLQEDLFEMNTSLYQLEGMDVGQGRISGLIEAENRNGVESHRSYAQVPVILCSPDYKPLAWTATNEYGQFVFENIPLGNYILHADLIGFWSSDVNINLSQGYPINDSTRIQLTLSSPFSVDEYEKTVTLQSLHPNPVTNKLSLDLTTESSCILDVNVLNIYGQILKHEQYSSHSENNTIILDVADIPSGLYLISIYSSVNMEVITKKFIKK